MFICFARDKMIGRRCASILWWTQLFDCIHSTKVNGKWVAAVSFVSKLSKSIQQVSNECRPRNRCEVGCWLYINRWPIKVENIFVLFSFVDICCEKKICSPQLVFITVISEQWTVDWTANSEILLRCRFFYFIYLIFSFIDFCVHRILNACFVQLYVNWYRVCCVQRNNSFEKMLDDPPFIGDWHRSTKRT